MKSKLDADVVPYADFGVFGPRGARFAKIVKYTAQIWDPATCTFTPKEFKGPRTLDEWRAHWRVYSFALRCFGALDRARLQQYANQIERLHSDYANLPGGGWWIIAVADVRMRSEHMEKLRRKAEQAYASNPGSGFDPALPWDWVFALAARDRDFWAAHVKDRAGQYMHHLKSKGDTGLPHDGSERVRVNHCVCDHTRQGANGGTGSGGTVVLECPASDRKDERSAGADDSDQPTATSDTFVPEAPRRNALYNFEKGNFKMVGRWGNTLVSTEHYVEPNPPPQSRDCAQ